LVHGLAPAGGLPPPQDRLLHVLCGADFELEAPREHIEEGTLKMLEPFISEIPKGSVARFYASIQLSTERSRSTLRR